MNIGSNDAMNMAAKSQMVGYTQSLRPDQQIRETDKSQEIEKARDADAESTTASNTLHVGSSTGAVRTQPRRRSGPESGALQRTGVGRTDWDSESGQGSEWLPPSLRPQSRTAGASNEWNVPYWLAGQHQEPREDSPFVQHRRLLNGLKSYVNIEIQQYVKSNDPPYAKKVLRDIYNVLDDDSGPHTTQPTRPGITGEPTGLTGPNWSRAESTIAMLENPPVEPGEALDMVA